MESGAIGWMNASPGGGGYGYFCAVVNPLTKDSLPDTAGST